MDEELEGVDLVEVEDLGQDEGLLDHGGGQLLDEEAVGGGGGGAGSGFRAGSGPAPIRENPDSLRLGLPDEFRVRRASCLKRGKDGVNVAFNASKIEVALGFPVSSEVINIRIFKRDSRILIFKLTGFLSSAVSCGLCLLSATDNSCFKPGDFFSNTSSTKLENA